MSTALYDSALIKKLKYWTQNTQLKIYNPSDTKRLFEVIADEKNDGPIALPIICVRRNGGYTIKNTNRQPISYQGRVVARSEDKAMSQNAIPIELSYQIDIYSRYYTEADDIVRNLVFNIINFPQLNMEIPYLNQNIPHQSTLYLNGEVADNSDVPERFVNGNFTRLTLSVTVPDAYLWDIRITDTSSIVSTAVEAKDKEDEPIPEFDEDNNSESKGIVIRDTEQSK